MDMQIFPPKMSAGSLQEIFLLLFLRSCNFISVYILKYAYRLLFGS